MIEERLDAAIVGGGVSGTSLAAALSSRAKPDFRAVVFEPNDLGPGTAYSPQSASLLVNGPVRAMSAVAGDKKHLERWLVDEPDDALICRARYGAYMRSVAAATLASHAGISHVRAQITDLEAGEGGFTLRSSDGTEYTARSVVLALGNFPPDESFLPRELRDSPHLSHDPWRVDVTPFENRDIALIGNRLTAMDVIALLDERAFRGRIHLISRHGYVPNVEDPRVRGIDFGEYALDYSTPLRILRAMRRIAATYEGDWRAIIEGLRPMSPHIWASWSFAERRRFLRHLQSIWGAHRYRVPAATFAAYARMHAEGRIVHHRGRIERASVFDDGISLELDHAGATSTVRAAHVVNCSGPNPDITRVANPLVKNALRRGLIRSDELSLGVETTASYRAVNANGGASASLYAMGPLIRGLWYETTAVPEITAHAAAIAAELLNGAANGYAEAAS